MSINILLLETDGAILKKLQNNSLMQSIKAQTFYLSDPKMGNEVILQRQIDVVVANFNSNLENLNDFCIKAREQAPFFIMFVLLLDEKSYSATNEIKYAHQTLASSCSDKEIVAAIGRGVQVANEVKRNPKLNLFLSKLDSLPSPPSVYFDLRDQLGLPNCNASALTQIISRDQALAAKILSVANSGFYAVPRTISSLQQAVSLLGTETLLGLVLATHLFDSLPLPGFNLDNLWKHAIGVALMARYIAKERGAERDQVEASGIAGLLHDLGSLVFLSNRPADYQAMHRNVNGDETELIEKEQQYFGVDHAELGGLILLLWGLPDLVVNAVKRHHDYDLQSTLVTSSPTWAVVIAEWMFNFAESVSGDNEEEFLDTLPFNCSAEQFAHWLKAFGEIQVQAAI